MPYANLEQVKVKFVSTDLGPDFDDTIIQKLNDADAFIDNKLKKHGESVPLSSPSALIVNIAADIAAGLFEEDELTQGEGLSTKKSIKRQRGEEALEDYIKTTYDTPYLGEDYGIKRVESTSCWEE